MVLHVDERDQPDGGHGLVAGIACGLIALAVDASPQVRQASSRLLRLLSLLQACRDWPGPLLAERLEISERTVRRDVDRLRELGYRIRAIKGPDSGYRLDSGSARS